jgi:hypothetical protein
MSAEPTPVELTQIERARMLLTAVETATVPDAAALHGRLLEAQAIAAVEQAEAMQMIALSGMLADGVLVGALVDDVTLRVDTWARRMVS